MAYINSLKRLIIHGGVEQVKKGIKKRRKKVNGRHECEIWLATRKQVYNRFPQFLTIPFPIGSILFSYDKKSMKDRKVNIDIKLN